MSLSFVFVCFVLFCLREEAKGERIISSDAPFVRNGGEVVWNYWQMNEEATNIRNIFISSCFDRFQTNCHCEEEQKIFQECHYQSDSENPNIGGCNYTLVDHSLHSSVIQVGLSGVWFQTVQDHQTYYLLNGEGSKYSIFGPGCFDADFYNDDFSSNSNPNENNYLNDKFEKEDSSQSPLPSPPPQPSPSPSPPPQSKHLPLWLWIVVPFLALVAIVVVVGIIYTAITRPSKEAKYVIVN